VHILLCQGSGLPVFFLLSPAKIHDAPFAQPLLQGAVRLYHLHPRVIRLDAGYWGSVSSVGSILFWGLSPLCPGSAIRLKNRFCLPPTWTREELGKCTAIERYFRRVFLFFHLQHPPFRGWTVITMQVALTYIAPIVVALAARTAGARLSSFVRATRVLAHSWEGF
jgi:hypothetical protein